MIIVAYRVSLVLGQLTIMIELSRVFIVLVFGI